MITVKLVSEVFKDVKEYGYREGDIRITVNFQHDNKEIKCIILPSTNVDGESFENYYDGQNTGELSIFGEDYYQQITDHLSKKVLQGFFNDKPIGFEYSFELD